MTIEFKLPELGENIKGGDVVNILVAVGSTVAPDQDVLELETDKATVTVPTSVGGLIEKIHTNLGEKVVIGQLILTLQGDAPAPKTTAPKAAPAPVSSPPPQPVKTPVKPQVEKPQNQEFKLPALGENIAGGSVVNVLVAVGDTVVADQDILELETDKATVTVPTSVSGVIKEVHVKPGDQVKIGQLVLSLVGIGTVQTVATPQAEAKAVAKIESFTPVESTPTQFVSALAPQVQPDPAHSAIPAVPNARRIAREIGVDITQVASGSTGRVTISDVKVYARQRNQGLTIAPTSEPVPVPTVMAVSKALPDFGKWGEIQREKMSNIRRATANQMAYAWTSAPRVTQFDKADIEEIEQLRKKYGVRIERPGVKLTITAILLKVVAAALKQFPKFNASIDLANEEVIFKKYYHVGVAVDTPNGLLVPVVREVDRKNIFELAVELGDLAQKAKERKLSLDEMQGGTFTISNLGGIGGTNFTPIVNAPEVAILGVARASIEPIFRDGQFVPRLMMPLSLSYDHRLIDGAEGARFLRWIVTALEDPLMMSLQAW